MADSGCSRDHAFGDAVQVLAQLADSSEEAAAEQAVLSAAFEALCINSGLTPGPNPRVALKLHKCGLLEKASTDHREYGNCRIDFAWPNKRVGLRVSTWPGSRTCGSVVPEFVYTDAFLREHGWLIFQVDPASNTFDEQLSRAISVIKRMGPYPRRAS
jgi:hypothetical protein